RTPAARREGEGGGAQNAARARNHCHAGHLASLAQGTGRAEVDLRRKTTAWSTPHTRRAHEARSTHGHGERELGLHADSGSNGEPRTPAGTRDDSKHS